MRQAREDRAVVDRRTLRRMFLSAFKSEGLDYAGGGCQVVHPDLTWSLSLVVDGTGKHAPYRLVLGASVDAIGDDALVWHLSYERSDTTDVATPAMPDAAFPEWSGPEDERVGEIARCVSHAVRYARQVDSLSTLQGRYEVGDYNGALITASMRSLLEAP